MPRLLPALATGLLLACGGAADKADDTGLQGTGDTSAVTSVTALTFNAGLAIGFVPAANERADTTAALTVDVGADIVCLQEVWTAEHVQVFENAAGNALPHGYFPAPQQVSSDTAACADGDLDDLLGCLTEECGDACIDELPDCLLANCALPFALLPSTCSQCTQANVGAEPDDIRQICENGSVAYAYGGAFGTGILSAYPLSDTEELVFDSTTNRRSVLHAVVDHPTGPVDVFCTHLTADLSPIPYTGEADSWAAEQLAQVGALVDWVDQIATQDLVLLLGDMNNGPDVGDSEAEFPDHYDGLLASGLVNPYVDAGGPCTFCTDNNLRGADSDDEDRVIDHIFVTPGQSTTTERVLDDPLQTESCGEAIQGHPSDHYGVWIEIAR